MFITTDIYCATCDYDLRGLDPAGRCPECGDLILPSLNFGARVRPFVRRLVFGIGLCFFVVLLEFLSEKGLKLIAPGFWFRCSQHRLYWVLHFYAPVTLQLFAAWILTPRRTPRRTSPSFRWSVRLCLLPLIAYFIARCSLDYEDAFRMWWFDHAYAATGILWPLFLGQWLVKTATSVHFRGIAIVSRVWQIALALCIIAEFGTGLYFRSIHHLFLIHIRGRGFATSVCLLAACQDIVSALCFLLLLVLALRALRSTPPTTDYPSGRAADNKMHRSFTLSQK